MEYILIIDGLVFWGYAVCAVVYSFEGYFVKFCNLSSGIYHLNTNMITFYNLFPQKNQIYIPKF